MPDQGLPRVTNHRRNPGITCRFFLALVLLAVSHAAAAQMVLSEGTNLSADLSPVDRRIAIDLLGSIWLLPPGGGAAEKVSNGLEPAVRPQWSPDGKRILYQAISPTGSRIRMLDVESRASSALTDGANFDQHPEWHPSGERIAFSSARGDSGFDLWEMHLETGLSWRLSQHPGDETEPAWSPDGRDLAYIRRQDDEWRLVLRRHGRSDQDLVISDQPLAAPAWRPDGSLLTFLRFHDEKYRLEMVILSDPPLSRPLATNEDFFLAPVSWRDRLHFVYTADGIIKTRGLNDWRAGTVAFTAEVEPPELALRSRGPADDGPPKELAIVSPPDGRLVIRAARLFDGVAPGYRNDVDVLLDGGRIAAVEYRHDWDDTTVLDLGDATILPGYIDSYASLPDEGAAEIGLALLACGITTIVASGAENFDPALWETEQHPGPRLLRAAPLGEAATDGPVPLALLTIPPSGPAQGGDTSALETLRQHDVPLLAESLRVGVAVGAELLLGAATMPASPLGRRYQDVRIAAGTGPATLVSGLADAATPGVSELFQSRQALAFEHWFAGRAAPTRRFPEMPDLAGSSAFIVGSKPNGLPAGLALHAELRALSEAGLSGEQVLRAAGANAADALGFPGQLGRIVPGALADLVLVSGDPQARIADALDIVAVVRNGRFYSLVRLLEEARRAPLVE